ncbi:hypothetical protein T484DRAFT_2273926 [Baffinella frigidus]|nr:hypothetical protein T484DRAFT_2273926 [Cryptophyta sp. CCMP2293]
MRRGSSLRSVNSTGVKFSVNFNLASEAVEKEESPRKVDTDASKVASTFDAPATFERTGMPANESLQSPLMSDEGSPMRVRRNLPGASSPAISPPSGRREGGIEGRGGGSQEGSPLQGGEEGRMLGSPQLQRRTTLEEYQSGHAGQFPLRPRKRRSQGVESGRARSTERRPVLNLDARLSWEVPGRTPKRDLEPPHTVDCGPSIKRQLSLKQLTLRPYLVQV